MIIIRSAKDDHIISRYSEDQRDNALTDIAGNGMIYVSEDVDQFGNWVIYAK